MKNINVEYFAILRECAGRDNEQLATAAVTAGELFTELAQRYAFPELNSVKVAVNDEFAGWDVTLTEGDSVVFIPPVAGG
jgi:molybdopterin converting factor subunit 1